MGSRSCFDIIARKRELVLLVKVLSNIEGLNSNTVHELKKVSSIMGGVPIVVGERLKSSKLLEGVLYERYGVHALNIETLADVMSNSMPVAHSIRGNYCVNINSEMLRRLRTRMDLTQEELARELGVSKQSVYRYESSGKVLFDVMERMMEVFKHEGRLLLHETVFGQGVKDESNEFNMHVARMKRFVAEKLDHMGFSTSITNAPFDVVARDDENVYTVVSNDQRRLEHKVELMGQITRMVGGHSMCVTSRQVSFGKRGVVVMKPEDLDSFHSTEELIEWISG